MRNSSSNIYLFLTVMFFLLFLPGTSDASVIIKNLPPDDWYCDYSTTASLEKHMVVSMERASVLYGRGSTLCIPFGMYHFASGDKSIRNEFHEWSFIDKESQYFSSFLKWANSFGVELPEKSKKYDQAAIHALHLDPEFENVSFNNIKDEFNASYLVHAFNEESAWDSDAGFNFFVLMQNMEMERQINSWSREFPEPGSLFILGAGLVIMAFICRKAIVNVEGRRGDIQR